jgi:enamine deaminase RidA (YjgF/YER057c/UK114 family)
MTVRRNISGDSPFEPIIGFSRAVRVGSHVHVSGTGPVGADEADAAAQTRHTLRIIEKALAAAGATLGDVVRTRMYLTHVEDWEAVGRIHGEFFGDIRPAATMLVVAKLLNPAWRIEIEADAVLAVDPPIAPPTAPETPPSLARERIRVLEKKALQKLRKPRPTAT